MTTINQTLIKQPLPQTRSPIQDCVQAEMAMYFHMLDGQTPHKLYRLVMDQAEKALLTTVLAECNGNQSKTAIYLGLSRGTLRSKISDYEYADKKLAQKP